MPFDLAISPPEIYSKEKIEVTENLADWNFIIALIIRVKKLVIP